MSAIPAELWLLILRYATYVPGALDTETRSPFAENPPLSTDVVQEHVAASLPTKLSLIRVCKQWNVLATKWLYETVLITKVTALRNLAGRILASEEDGGEKIGSWLRRLDVEIYEDEASAEDVELLISTIHCLPNLIIFFIRLRRPFGSGEDGSVLPPSLRLSQGLIRVLAETCGSCLRVLEWRSLLLDHTDRFLRPDIYTLRTLFAATPQLQVFRCEAALVPPMPLNYSLPRLDSMALTTLGFSRATWIWDEQECISQCLPALQHIVVYDSHIGNRPWTRILPHIGRMLRIIEFHIDVFYATEYVPSWIESIANHCPQLQDLIVSSSNWPSYKGLLVPLPILHLELKCIGLILKNTVLPELSGLASMPRLKVLRLGCRNNAARLRQRLRRNPQSVATLVARGVSVEDYGGHRLVD